MNLGCRDRRAGRPRIVIATGSVSNAMALLADGWHGSAHVAAFLVAVATCHLSCRHASDAQLILRPGKGGPGRPLPAVARAVSSPVEPGF